MRKALFAVVVAVLGLGIAVAAPQERPSSGSSERSWESLEDSVHVGVPDVFEGWAG